MIVFKEFVVVYEDVCFVIKIDMYFDLVNWNFDWFGDNCQFGE